MTPTTKRALHVDIRWMIRANLYRVLDIEFESFEHPWTEDEMRSTLKRTKAVGLVATVDDEIAGFVVYELFPNHIAILDLAVAPEYRRRRVGTQIVSKLQNKLAYNNRSALRVLVREKNLAAQCFFRENGFVCTGVVRDHYDDMDEDAYQFAFALGID